MVIRKANTSSPVATETQVRLSTVYLPEYDGDIKEWPNFKNLKNNKETISIIQKFVFLKSTLMVRFIQYNSIHSTIHSYKQQLPSSMAFIN